MCRSGDLANRRGGERKGSSKLTNSRFLVSTPNQTEEGHPAPGAIKADPYVLLLAKLIRDVEARERVIVLSERRAA